MWLYHILYMCTHVLVQCHHTSDFSLTSKTHRNECLTATKTYTQPNLNSHIHTYAAAKQSLQKQTPNGFFGFQVFVRTEWNLWNVDLSMVFSSILVWNRCNLGYFFFIYSNRFDICFFVLSVAMNYKSIELFKSVQKFGNAVTQARHSPHLESDKYVILNQLPVFFYLFPNLLA